MEIIDRDLYYNKVMKAYVVNAYSQDDPNGEQRVQVYIPNVHCGNVPNYQTYMQGSDSKKGKDGFRKFTWVYNTQSDIKNGDLVYIINVNNQLGDYVIIGRDITSISSNGVGGSDMIGGMSISEFVDLVLPIIYHNEVGVGTLPTLQDVYTSLSDDKYATYITNYKYPSITNTFSVGLLQWDNSRAFNILVESARDDANWESYWTDKSCDFFNAIKYDVEHSTNSGASKASLGNTSDEGIINSAKSMLKSSAGKGVQDRYARYDTSDVVSALQEIGVTNPAIIIYMTDFVNQYTTADNARHKLVYETIYENAINPSNITSFFEQANPNADKSDMMMYEFECFNYWVTVEYQKVLHEDYTSRRRNTASYIRELYKEGKLYSAGLTTLDGIIGYTHNDITLYWPFKDDINENFTYSYSYCGTIQLKSPKKYPITSLFGARYLTAGVLSYHHGVDFGCPRGTEILACHDGVAYSCTEGGGHSGFGYYVRLEFTNNNDKWSVYYGHLIGGTPEQYGITSSGVNVKVGQVLGQTNTTGSSQGNHLHYELRKNGMRLNPLPYMGLGDTHTPLDDISVSD